MGQTMNNSMEQAQSPPRAFMKAEDGQLQHTDSDDEYEGVKR
jgi:hypothetical protein